MKKIICYRVDDNCDVPVIYDDLTAALEYVKDLMEGIDERFPIKIERIDMTQREFDTLPEL